MRLHRAISQVFLMVLGLLIQSCGSNKAYLLKKKYPPAELKMDAALYKDVCLAMHPVVGIYESGDKIKEHFETFIAGLKDSLTERQFRLKLKVLTAQLRCGHTDVIASPLIYKQLKKLKQNYSHYLFLPVNERLYVIQNTNKKIDSTLARGTEITRINGVAVDSMIRYCRHYVSRDGYNQTGPKHYIELGFNAYFPVLFGRPDTFTLEYKSGNGLKTIRYPAVKLANLPLPTLKPLTDSDSLFTRYKRAAMKYRYLDTAKKTMYVRISRFSNSKYSKAYRKVFKKLKTNKSQNLVIDLRSNGGGSIANSYRLLSYLIDSAQKQTLATHIKNYPFRKYTHGNAVFKFTRLFFTLAGKKESRGDTDSYTCTIKPRKRNHFNGKVYVLINGGSFSASCLVSAYLNYRQRASFIGEETGGAMEGCNAGITPYYRLPNTDIRVRMPAYRIVHNVSPGITGHGILPGITTFSGINDILARRDIELAKVMELLGIKQ